MRRLAPFCLATVLATFGLSCVGTAEPPMAVRVDWGLDGPLGTIPTAVTQVTVVFDYHDGSMPESAITTIGTLMDMDMDMDGHPDLLRRDLRTGVPLWVTIEGQSSSGAIIYLGHAGPFVLSPGERRYVDVRMYQVNGYSTVDMGGMPARLLATATTLSDGRVLVTGGFTRATSMTCPAPYTTMDTCFDLTATSDAWLFDVASGTLHQVLGGMHQVRGGHTATLLPGDRVLVAGGAAHAMLVLQHVSSTVRIPILVSLDTMSPASTSFEIFRPDDNAEDVDVDRDGDPGRGGFVGAADSIGTLGRMDIPRFLHAAAPVPGHPSQVLLVGGVGGETTWTVYDDQRAGGYGVLDSTMNHLHTPRTMPTVAQLHGAMGDAIWIFGGGDAASDADLAEVWTSTAAAPNGSTVPATMRGFPDATMTDRPEYALIGATAVGLDASHAVVVGWYGPQCAAGVPTFGGPDRCDFDAMTSRSFTIDGMTGRAVATTTRQRHAFGAGVHMSDGSAIVVGGIGALTLTPNTGTEHFLGTVPSSGAAMLSDVQPLLNQARLFAAAAALDDQGVIVFGGLNINTTGATPSATLVGAPEVMYLPRASM